MGDRSVGRVTNPVRVWVVPVAPRGDDADVCAPAESARAAQRRSGRRWLANRAALRRILGAAIGADPTALVFGQTASGKLVLELVAGVHFNLSHSGELVAVAVADRPVGIDVEVCDRHLVRPEALAGRLFADRSEWETLPEPERTRALLQQWTRAEALLKATGEGVGGGVSDVERRIGALGFSVRELGLGGAAVGAVAAEGVDWRVELEALPPQ